MSETPSGTVMRVLAEMVRGDGMVSPDSEDHSWYVTTPMAERRRILKQAEQADERLKLWAITLRRAWDKLMDERTAVPTDDQRP